MSGPTFANTMRLAQGFLSESKPVLVLGSGASCAHGLPGMGPLGEYIRRHVQSHDLSTSDAEAWAKFKDELARMGLEAALDQIRPSDELTRRIVRATWECVSAADMAVFESVATGQTSLPLAEVLRHFVRTAQGRVDVVTTNYDCLVEYACDDAAIACSTGMRFGHSIRRFDPGTEPGVVARAQPPRGLRQDPTVNVWKVHGSLDWFVRESNEVFALGRGARLLDGAEPVVVTPGTTKYRSAHREPFRTMINRADAAMAEAGVFLCVGYGFNDEHLQPKLLHRCRNSHVPLVLLTHGLTQAARTELLGRPLRKFLVLECAETETRAYSNEAPDGFLLAEPNLWALETFYRRVLAPEAA